MIETPVDLFKVQEVEIYYKNTIKNSARPLIDSSACSAELLRNHWDTGKIDHVEEFKVILLNHANRVLGIYQVSSGGITATIADPRNILQAAILSNATSLILCHNHPSGNLKPSQADEILTLKLTEAAKYVDIRVLDHIILTSESHFSFADEGIL